MISLRWTGINQIFVQRYSVAYAPSVQYSPNSSDSRILARNTCSGHSIQNRRLAPPQIDNVVAHSHHGQTDSYQVVLTRSILEITTAAATMWRVTSSRMIFVTAQ